MPLKFKVHLIVVLFLLRYPMIPLPFRLCKKNILHIPDVSYTCYRFRQRVSPLTSQRSNMCECHANKQYHINPAISATHPSGHAAYGSWGQQRHTCSSKNFGASETCNRWQRQMLSLSEELTPILLSKFAICATNILEIHIRRVSRLEKTRN
jgi:hypothetical protein